MNVKKSGRQVTRRGAEETHAGCRELDQENGEKEVRPNVAARARNDEAPTECGSAHERRYEGNRADHWPKGTDWDEHGR
jgi:hypothetical protein